AGVIFKEGLTIHGLTTAASVWVTAAIGILIGVGFWTPALMGAGATLVMLGIFRSIEDRMPLEVYFHHQLRFRREAAMAEDEVRRLVGGHGFSVAHFAFCLIEEGRYLEYRMAIRSRDRDSAQALAEHLLKLPEVVEFRISPMGD